MTRDIRAVCVLRLCVCLCVCVCVCECVSECVCPSDCIIECGVRQEIKNLECKENHGGIRAVMKIREGEEITISYRMDLFVSTLTQDCITRVVLVSSFPIFPGSDITLCIEPINLARLSSLKSS